MTEPTRCDRCQKAPAEVADMGRWPASFTEDGGRSWHSASFAVAVELAEAVPIAPACPTDEFERLGGDAVVLTITEAQRILRICQAARLGPGDVADVADFALRISDAAVGDFEAKVVALDSKRAR